MAKNTAAKSVTNKSLIIILLGASIVLGAATFIQTSLPGEGRFTVPVSQLNGDINSDGGIGSDDAIILSEILVGSVQPTSSQQRAGDFNQNGEIDSSDLTDLENFVVMSGGDVRRCQDQYQCREFEFCSNGICAKRTGLPGDIIQNWCLCGAEGPRIWVSCGEKTCGTCCTDPGDGGGSAPSS